MRCIHQGKESGTSRTATQACVGHMQASDIVQG